MSISHAYVIFTNGSKKIVPLTEIPNFHPKSDTDFDKSKKRKVWLNEEKDRLLLNAFVLLLGSKYNISENLLILL